MKKIGLYFLIIIFFTLHCLKNMPSNSDNKSLLVPIIKGEIGLPFGGTGGGTSGGATEKAVCDGKICLGSTKVYDGTSYSASGNNDGIPNKNETIRMDVSIGNNGTSDILGVSGTLSTTSNLVTIDQANATKSFGRLCKKNGNTIYYNSTVYNTPSQSCYGINDVIAATTTTFRITIPITTPDGSVIPFTLALTDSSGNSYNLSFNITIQALGASIVLGSTKVYDGTSYSASGNNDGIPNKNETIRMDVSIGNNGTSDILGVSGTLSTTSNLVTIDQANATKSFGRLCKKNGNTIYYNSTVYNTPSQSCYGINDVIAATTTTFRITLSNSLPNYALIPFTLSLTDSSNNSWTVSFNIQTYPTGAIILSARTVYDTTFNNPLNTDGDGDTVIEKNETFRLNLGLKNTDTVAKSVSALTLSSASSYVTFLSNPTINYGSISAGATVYLNNSSSANVLNTWRIKIDNSTPSGTQIEFLLSNITGGFQDSFKIIVP
jgi:hypothetical protein